MLATLAGSLALLLGLSLLLLPLLLTELSRPRDSVWGAVVLLLGLVLVTSAERLTGAPMLAVLCGGLLVGRLGGEVAQGRWRALSDEERQALRSVERWNRSVHQLSAIAASLLQSGVGATAGVSAWLAERRQGRSHGKRWVRREAAAAGSDASGAPQSEPTPPLTGQAGAVSAMSTSPASAEADTPTPATGEPVSAAPPALDQHPGAASVVAQDNQAIATASPGPADAAGDPEQSVVRVVADFNGIDALLDAAEDEPVERPQDASGDPAGGSCLPAEAPPQG